MCVSCLYRYSRGQGSPDTRTDKLKLMVPLRSAPASWLLYFYNITIVRTPFVCESEGVVGACHGQRNNSETLPKPTPSYALGKSNKPWHHWVHSLTWTCLLACWLVHNTARTCVVLSDQDNNLTIQLWLLRLKTISPRSDLIKITFHRKHFAEYHVWIISC